MMRTPKSKTLTPTARLSIALVVSTCLHLSLFWMVVERQSSESKDQPKSPPSDKAATAPLTPIPPSEIHEPPLKPKPRHIPMIFVETDSSQPTGAPPEDTKFYGKQDTVAANPQVDPNKLGDMPLVRGTQDKVPSVADVPLASTRPSPPPSPPPAPPQPPTPAIQQQPPDVEPPKQTAKSETAPQEKVQPNEKPVTSDGQIIIPEPVSPKKTTPAKKEKVKSPTVSSPPRPQIAAAQQAPQPPSPAVPTLPTQRQIPARAAKMDQSSAARRGNVSLNVKGTPFGMYDEKLVNAVARRWHLMLQDKFMGDRRGTVVIEFVLKEDGSVVEARIVEESVGIVLATACLAAIQNSAPFETFTEEMRALLGGKPRELRFNFFY